MAEREEKGKEQIGMEREGKLRGRKGGEDYSDMLGMTGKWEVF